MARARTRRHMHRLWRRAAPADLGPVRPWQRPEGAGPGDVREEAVCLAVPRIEEGARALEDLLLQHVAVGACRGATWVVVGLRHAVGPDHAQHVGFHAVAQSEVHDRLVYDAHLVEIFGPQLDARSDAEGVVLAAAVA